MSYSVDELFSFEKNTYTRFGGYTLHEYLKKDDPTVTEIEIPAEYNGKRVTLIFGFSRSKYIKRGIFPPSVRLIEEHSFNKCASLENAELSEGLVEIGSHAFSETNLKSVVLPKSLKRIGLSAFWYCKELERVEFNSKPSIGLNAFGSCPKLPPETVAMGLVRSTDLTRPFLKWDFCNTDDLLPDVEDCIRPDVFELLAKNGCFRKCDLEFLFEIMMIENKAELFPVAAQYGMLENPELLDFLLSYAIKYQRIEITAYLLDLKNRKFGFDGGGNFEL